MICGSTKCIWLTAGLALGLAGLPGMANAQMALGAARQTPKNPVVVELFTSEGCSSCPPADEFVRELDQQQPVPGAQLIVLSEHVDYWDHDGWKDPYSSAALTDRQAAYERALGVSTSYTPQMIVDGADEIHLTDPHQIEKTLQREAARAKILVELEKVTLDASSGLQAHVAADGGDSGSKGEIYLAVALNEADSNVLRGENGGRYLVHTAVVVQMERIGKLEKGQKFEREVQLKLKPGVDPLNLRVIAFVQAPGQGKLLGAALWKNTH